MVSGCSAGSAGLSVCIGRHFLFKMYNAHSSCFILAHFPFQYIVMIVFSKVVYISAADVGGRVRGSTTVPLEIFLHNCLCCKISSPSSLALPYSDIWWNPFNNDL